MAADSNNYLDEVIGILLMVAGLLLGISLFTYHADDPSWFSTVTNRPYVQNAVGKVGATLSDTFFQMFGVASYCIPLFCLFLAVTSFKTGRKTLTPRILSGSALFIVTISSLAEFKRGADLAAPNLGGGMGGRLISQFFLDYFAPMGSLIVLFALLLLASMLVFPFSPYALVIKAWSDIKTVRIFVVGQFRGFLDPVREKKKYRLDRVPPPTITRTLNPPPLDPPEITARPKMESPASGKKGGFCLPPHSLLSDPQHSSKRATHEDWISQSGILEKKFRDFDIEGRVTAVHPGPVVTMFEFEPAPGIKLNRITNLADDLAIAMKALQVRIVAPLPAKSTVGIEIPNFIREEVLLKEVLSSPSFTQIESKTRLALGKDIFGVPVSADLAAMPHLLIAGSTGSGKSVGLNCMILSLLFSTTPTDVKMLLIDPKMLELTLYDGIPHLIAPVIVRAKAASMALKKMVVEMERRYQLISEKGVRNIAAYNKLLRQEKTSPPIAKTVFIHVPLPYIVIFIDELADLMMVAPRDVEDSITRLAQMSRAAGIHLVLATQRPSVDVITGVIKANFPARIAYCVSSKTDSRTILDANGAEQLLGKGDMLYLSAGTGKVQRIHGAYVSEEEVKKAVDFIKGQAAPEYQPPPLADEAAPEDESPLDARDHLYEEARELIIATGQASASFIQRRMRVGYPRAARMIEMMEEDGVIGPAIGSKPREVLIKKEGREANQNR